MQFMCDNPDCEHHKELVNNSVPYVDYYDRDTQTVVRVTRHRYISPEGEQLFICDQCRLHSQKFSRRNQK